LPVHAKRPMMKVCWQRTGFILPAKHIAGGQSNWPKRLYDPEKANSLCKNLIGGKNMPLYLSSPSASSTFLYRYSHSYLPNQKLIPLKMVHLSSIKAGMNFSRISGHFSPLY